MRTKNLNLKKKIAFIASVAMIASTAAYLPAEVTKDIFNSSISVSAAASTLDAEVYLTATINGEKKYFNATGTLVSAPVDLAATLFDAPTNTVNAGSSTDAADIKAALQTGAGTFSLDRAVPNGTVIYAEVKALGNFHTTGQANTVKTQSVNLGKIANLELVVAAGKTASYEDNYVDGTSGEKETLDFEDLAFEVAVGGVNSTGTYDETNDAWARSTIDKLDTLDAFIKINGKYVGYNDAAGMKDYKLVDRVDDKDYPALLAFADAGILAVNSETVLDEAAFATAAGADGYYNKKVNAAIEIPYFADAKTVTLEFVAKTNTAISERSITSIDIALDDNGIGRLGKQHDYVVGKSYDCNFDEAKGDYKLDPGTGLAAAAAGEFEVIDLSNLVVAMRGENKSTTGVDPESLNAVNGTVAKKNGTGAAITTGGTNPYFVENSQPAVAIDKEDVTPVSYDLMRINGKLARVIEIDSNVALEPGDKVEIETTKKAAWKESGTKDSKVTVVMGGNPDYPEYAISPLITHTSNDKKEYFVYVVKNKESAGMSDEAGTLTSSLTFTDPKGTATVGIANGAQALVDSDDLDVKLAADVKYRVDKKIVKETINNAPVYVTQYTIYNNETKDQFNRNETYRIKLDGVNALGTTWNQATADTDYVGDGTVNAGARILEKSKTSYVTSVYADPGQVVKATDEWDAWAAAYAADQALQTPTGNPASGPADLTIIKETSADTTLTTDGTHTYVDIKKTAAGTAESEVITMGVGANKVDNVKFVFTNEYEIKVDHLWDDNKDDLAKVGYDEKVEVAGQKVTKPEKIERLGFDFDGWKANTDADREGEVDVFRTDDWNEQYNEPIITPNVSLVAEYTGLRYDVVLDANGGKISAKGNSGTKAGTETDPQYIHGTATKVFVKDNFFSIERETNNDDLSYRTSVKAYREGYDFVGWSTDKDATKKMSLKELENAFPGEEKTLTLYAVYEAKDNIPVTFKQIMFDKNGVTLDTDGKASKYDADANDALFVSNENRTFGTDGAKYVEDASFSTTPSVTVEAGKPIGELPVPYEKGYDFEGWYAKTWNNTLSSVEYIKVDKDTIVDEKLFADQDQNITNYNGGDASNLTNDITLYAKFTQKTYNVTFDIGEGSWASSKISKPDGKLPATMTYSGYRGNKTEAEKLGFRRPDGEVISVDEWKLVDNPHWGSNEVNEFTKWTINGKGNYTDLAAVATALTKLTTLGDVTIKAVYEDTESSKSKIFLNANDGDFYAYKQAEKNPTTKAVKRYILTNDDKAALLDEENDVVVRNTTKYNNGTTIETVTCAPYIDEDGDGEYDAAETLVTIEDFQQSGLDLKGGTAGIRVSSKWNIDANGRTVEETQSGPNAMGYTVARAGYDFTGWYTDKACTKKYTFDKYPAKGTETILYAGWKKSNTTRYWLDFDVFNGDGSEVTLKRESDVDILNGLVKYRKTFMGTIEDIAYAKNLKIQIQDGTGTQATFKTYVFDPELSKNLNDTSKKIECEFSSSALVDGLFQQAEPYTTVYGRFVEEGFQSQEELQAPTNVRVVNGVVTWVGNDTAVKYQIKKIVNGKVSYSDYTDKTTLTIKNIPDEDYQVAVIAVDKNGKKVASSPVDVIVASSTLKAPTNVKVSDTGEVTWDAAEGAVKYQVLKVVGNTKAYTAKTTDLKIQLKSTAKDYKVYVIAFDSNGKSKRSEVVEGKAFTNGLGIVTDAKYAADTKTVTWTAVDNAVKYQVLKVVNGKKFYGPYVTGTSYTFKNVPDGAFAYYVIAKDAAGNSTRGTMNKVTNHPSVTDVKLADDNKTVTFKAVEGATGYQLCKIVPGKNPAYSAISTNTTITFKNACTSGTQVYVLAFFDEAHKDASYSETIIVK